MRYYPRMFEIEAARFQQSDPLKLTPQIDSWSNAMNRLEFCGGSADWN
jgi:hypothetical protein